MLNELNESNLPATYAKVGRIERAWDAIHTVNVKHFLAYLATSVVNTDTDITHKYRSKSTNRFRTLSLSILVLITISSTFISAYAATSAFVDQRGVTVNQTCGTPTTVATLTTSAFSAGTNLVIASVQVNSTDPGNENITPHNLILKNSTKTIATNIFSIQTGSSPTHNSYVMLARETGALANPTYTITACSDVLHPTPLVGAAAKIVALNGIINSALDNSTSVPVGTTQTTIDTLSSSLPAGDNIILAHVQISNGGNVQDIAANNVKLNNKSTNTVLASNQFHMRLDNAAPTSIQSILLIAKDIGVAASPTYNVTITGAAAGASAQATIMAFQSSSSAFAGGGSTIVGTAPQILKSVSTTFPSGSEVVAIGAGQFDYTGSSPNPPTFAVTSGFQLKQAGTARSNNTLQMEAFDKSGNPGDGLRHALIWRTASSPASPTYDLRATASASGYNGEGKIVAFLVGNPLTNSNGATFLLADTTKSATSKQLPSESLTSSDSANKNPNKSAPETLASSDSANKNPNKSAPETLASSDSIVKSAAKFLTESINLSDTVNLAAQLIKNVTDSLAFADTNVRAFSKKLDDPFSISDTVDHSGAFFTTLTETINYNDNIGNAVSKAVAETMNLADNISNTSIKQQTIAETLGLADDTSKRTVKVVSETFTLADFAAKDVAKMVQETFAIADAVSSAFSTSLAESIDIADTTTNGVSKSITESLALTDDIAKSVTKFINEAETFTDAVSSVFAISHTITEAMTLGDSVSNAAAFSSTLTESITFTDNLSSASTFFRTLTETINYNDNIGNAVSKAVAETMNLADNVSSNIALFRTLAETMVMTDDTTKSVSASIAESLTVGDATAKGVSKAFNEGVTFADSIITGSALGATINEGLTFADNVSNAPTVVKSISESLNLADNVSHTAAFAKTISETIAFADNFSSAGTFFRTLTEALAINDLVNAGAALITNLTETIGLGDSVGANIAIAKTLNESLALGDALSTKSSPSPTASLGLSDAIGFTHRTPCPPVSPTPVSCTFLGGLGVMGGGIITFPSVTGNGMISVTTRAATEPPPSGFTIVGLGGSTTSLDIMFIPLTDLHAVIGTIPVESVPIVPGVNSVTNKIYVPNSLSNTVSVIDGSTDTVIDTITVGANPRAATVNPATNKIYVTNSADNTVSVINGATDTVIGTIPVGSDPRVAGVNTVTNKIYVPNNAGNNVSVIDGSTDTVIDTITVGTNPNNAGVNTATNKIYVASNAGNTVSVINGATDTVIGTITVGNNPRTSAVNPVTNKIYVTNFGSNNVSVIDGSTDTVIGTIPVGVGPRSAAVNTVTNKIYVPNFGDNTVSVINGVIDNLVGTITVGTEPIGIAVNTATNKIYVTNSADNTVSVIADTPEFTVPLKISLTYNGTGLTPEQKGAAQLRHFEAGSWVDTTTSRDPANNIVSGQTNSLSPFAVMIPAVLPPPSAPSVPSAHRGDSACNTFITNDPKAFGQCVIVDTTPPAILSHYYQPTTPVAGRELTVTAKIEDDLGVGKVYLLYFITGNHLEFHQVPMQLSQGSFTGTIPASDLRTVGLKYWIFAEDLAGNTVQSAVKNLKVEQATLLPEEKTKQTSIPASVLQAIKPRPAEPVQKLEVISMKSGNEIKSLPDKIVIRNTGNITADNIRIMLSTDIYKNFRLSHSMINSIAPHSNVTITLEPIGSRNSDVLGNMVGYQGSLLVIGEHLSPIILPVDVAGEKSNSLSSFMDKVEKMEQQRYNKLSLLNSILKQPKVQSNYEVTTSKGENVITSPSGEIVIKNLSDKELQNIRIVISGAGNIFLLDNKVIHHLAPHAQISIRMIPTIDTKNYSPKDIKGELLIVPSNDNPINIPINIPSVERKDSTNEFDVRTMTGKDGIFTAADKVIIKNLGNRTMDSVKLMLSANLARVLTLSNDAFQHIEPNGKVVVDVKFKEEEGTHNGLEYNYQGELVVVSEHHMQKVIPINIVWKEFSSDHFTIYARNNQTDMNKARDVLSFLESNYQNITSRFEEMNAKARIYMTHSIDELKAVTKSDSYYAFSDDTIFICGCDDDVKSVAMKEFVHRIIFNEFPNYSNKQKFLLDGENWLMDGISTYIAANMTGEHSMVKKDLEAFKAKPTSFAWFGSGSDAQYGAAYTFFEYLHDKYGDNVIDRTLYYLGSGMVSNHRCDTLEDCAVLRAVYDVNGWSMHKSYRHTVDVKTLVSEWEDYVMKHYGTVVPKQDQR